MRAGEVGEEIGTGTREEKRSIPSQAARAGECRRDFGPFMLGQKEEKDARHMQQEGRKKGEGVRSGPTVLVGQTGKGRVGCFVRRSLIGLFPGGEERNP